MLKKGLHCKTSTTLCLVVIFQNENLYLEMVLACDLILFNELSSDASKFLHLYSLALKLSLTLIAKLVNITTIKISVSSSDD